MTDHDEVRALREEFDGIRKSLEDRIHHLELDMYLYKGLIRFIKWCGAALACVLAFKFGDIKYLSK